MSQYLDPNRRERAPIESWTDGFEIIPARSTSESEPDYIIPLQSTRVIRAYVAYGGTVTAANVRLWYFIRDVWYRGPSTNDGDPLTGVNEARDWFVEPGTRIGFTIDSITGGGTAAVTVESVRSDEGYG